MLNGFGMERLDRIWGGHAAATGLILREEGAGLSPSFACPQPLSKGRGGAVPLRLCKEIFGLSRGGCLLHAMH